MATILEELLGSTDDEIVLTGERKERFVDAIERGGHNLGFDLTTMREAGSLRFFRTGPKSFSVDYDLALATDDSPTEKP